MLYAFSQNVNCQYIIAVIRNKCGKVIISKYIHILIYNI